MAFSFNRTNDLRLNKKNITISNTINPNSLKSSVGSTGSSDFLLLTNISLNNIPVNATADQLSYLNAQPGIANKSSALIANSTRNISGINVLNCSSNIIVNNSQINGITDIPGSADDVNNPLMTNITLGIGQANKALLANYKCNISKINKLTTNNMKIQNYNLSFNNTNDTYDLNIMSKLNYFPSYYYIDKILTNLLSCSIPGQISSNYNICWSPELQIFVGVSGSSNISKNIVVSSDGYGWTEYSSTNKAIGLTCIIWIKELNMFVAGGSSGYIQYSNDGINWYTSAIITSNQIADLCWSKELNLIVAVTTNGNIINSIDGINWNYSYSNGYNASSAVFSSVCWANAIGLFVACCSNNSITSRIYISNDGNNWTHVSNSLLNGSNWSHVIWAEELNMLVMCGNPSSSQKIVRSADGINWYTGYANENNSFWNSYSIKKLVWINDLHIFIAINSGSSVYLSYDGITWNCKPSFGVGGQQSICWSSKLGCLVIATNSITITVSNCTKTSLSGLKSSNELVNVNQDTNYIGIGTSNPIKPLHINDNLGKCLRIHPNPSSYLTYPNFVEFNILNNGQFNINATTTSGPNTKSNVNILTDNLTYGLKLNNTLLIPTVTEYSYINNITNGSVSNSKIVVTDSNINISNISSLSCNALIANNVSINNNSNHIYLRSLSLGNAVANKALITDYNNDIKNINIIKTNQHNLKYDRIFGSNNSNTINIAHLNNKYYNNVPTRNNITNKLSTANNWIYPTTYSTVSNIWYHMIWCAEFSLFIAINSAGVLTSPNGITWTLNSLLTGADFSNTQIAYSPELKTAVIFKSTNTISNIFVSNDGKSWFSCQGFNPFYIYGNFKCLWISELKAFVAISNNGSMMSREGHNWTQIGLPSKNWISMTWCTKSKVLVAVSNNTTTTPNLAISSNLESWTYINGIGQNDFVNQIVYNSVCYSPELNLAIANSSTTYNSVSYSTDGINWNYSIIPYNIYSSVWIKEFNAFIGTSSTGLFYSNNGLTWYSLTTLPVTGNFNTICWSPELSTLVIGSTSGASTYSIAVNVFGLPNSTTYLSALPNQLYFDKINNRLGIGNTVPNYQLDLSTDNAAKPSTSTWTIVSDSRLKYNIELANLSQCYNIIKNLKLKKYTWKDNIFTNNQIYDKTKLGWIADDVELVFPKAVEHKKLYNLDDCKTLNIDQIIASIYGCTQQLMANYENNNDIDIIKTNLENIENFINNLDIIN
jgi:hypothetical protein